MRLVLVTETFSPEVNGVARTLGHWVDAFRCRGHTVDVIRPRQQAEGPAPGRVAGLPLPFYAELRFGLASPLHIARALNPRPDLVHVATEGPLGFAAVLACRRLGIPVATSFHTNFDDYLEHYGLGSLRSAMCGYLRWLHNAAAVTLVPSDSTRRRLEALGFQRVEVWSRGVDAEVFHPRHRDPALRQSFGLGPDDPLLLYVGRLAAEKNLAALLAAFARIRGRRGNAAVRLALVGGGPLAESLRRRPPTGVVLAGVQRGVALSRWYASADLFAFPSRSETFGNVVVEAMASGLPVVAFDGPGVRDQVCSDREGLLVSTEDELADALAQLCADRDRRRHLGHAARSKAAERDWASVFDALEQRYRGLAAAVRTEPATGNC